jgi:hypothetical protein
VLVAVLDVFAARLAVGVGLDAAGDGFTCAQASTLAEQANRSVKNNCSDVFISVAFVYELLSAPRRSPKDFRVVLGAAGLRDDRWGVVGDGDAGVAAVLGVGAEHAFWVAIPQGGDGGELLAVATRILPACPDCFCVDGIEHLGNAVTCCPFLAGIDSAAIWVAQANDVAFVHEHAQPFKAALLHDSSAHAYDAFAGSISDVDRPTYAV